MRTEVEKVEEECFMTCDGFVVCLQAVRRSVSQQRALRKQDGTIDDCD
jgi:hypothetical protein